ncbi:MAG: potassium transporter TrkG, partial [Phycisphaerae bacterium]
MKLELRVVFRQLGLLLAVLSVFTAATALFAGVQRVAGSADDPAALPALLLSAVITAAVGGLLYVTGRRTSKMLGQREALLLVALSWLVAAALAALPFRIWSAMRDVPDGSPHDFDTYVSCYFEAMSGFTTTGATVVQALDTLPDGLLLWRALTHWLGGLGIVVLFVAVLPMLGGASRRVYRLEAPGPSPEGVKPRIQDTARVLWLIYTGLTIAEVLALRLCGMGWFDATCHTFATLATGGFG